MRHQIAHLSSLWRRRESAEIRTLLPRDVDGACLGSIQENCDLGHGVRKFSINHAIKKNEGIRFA